MSLEDAELTFFNLSWALSAKTEACDQLWSEYSRIVSKRKQSKHKTLFVAKGGAC